MSASGDVPPARSGASMCSFAPHILMLFGGINFEEEAVYNDLYTLNTRKLAIRRSNINMLSDVGVEVCR